MRLSEKMFKTSLSFDVFLTFEGQPRTKHIRLRHFLDKLLPKMLSKSMIPFETSLKKSEKKRRAIAPPGLVAHRGSAELWEALVEL